MKRLFRTSISTLTFCSLLFLGLNACQSEANRLEGRQAAIELEVARKLEAFRTIKAQNCREDILATASRIADSLIIANARMQLDTTLKPAKPFKPEQPSIQTLIDSVPVKPLFPNRPKKDSTSNH